MLKELEEKLGADATKAIWIHCIEFIWLVSFGMYLLFRFWVASTWELLSIGLCTLVVEIGLYFLKKRIKYEERAEGTQFDKLVNIMAVFIFVYGFGIMLYLKW